jgi:hypothetical protein
VCCLYFGVGLSRLFPRYGNSARGYNADVSIIVSSSLLSLAYRLDVVIDSSFPLDNDNVVYCTGVMEAIGHRILKYIFNLVSLPVGTYSTVLSFIMMIIALDDGSWPYCVISIKF